MSRAIVVLHTNPFDGVAEVLRGRPGVTCVHLDEISKHWAIGEGHAPTDIAYPEPLLALFTDAYVINRVFDFNHCEAGRRLQAADLHGLWGYIALSALLERAHTLAHENGSRGVSRSLLPLNAQWFKLAGICNGIAFPAFEFGFGRVDPDLSKLTNALQKSLWSYFSWKTENSLNEEEKDWHRFYVDRPEGTPVVCIYHEGNIELQFPRGNVEVDRSLYQHIADGARQAFASEMGELLLYEREGAPPLFCAFSPYMANATRSATFGDAVMETLAA